MSDSLNSKKWYVIKVVGGQEIKVKDYIENEIFRFGLSDYVSQVLVPVEKIIHVRNGKKYARDRFYFPGYVMIEANLAGEVPHVIRSVTGVVGFLGGKKGGDPIPMRLSEINRMLGKVDELMNQSVGDAFIPYIIGETVKVTGGPFNGFDAVIENIHEEKKKLEVRVKIFGRETPLELDYMQVDKIF